MRESAVTSRQATDRDTDAVTETLTLAFAADPVWGRWAFPDPERGGAQRRAYFRFFVRSALRHPWVRVTPGCEAVAMWIPPEAAELAEDDERGVVAMVREMLGGRAERFLAGTDLFASSHPRRPHYYLGLLGTHDAHRGKGLGMALLRENLSRIDALRMPAYLESTNPVNLPRYQGLGFAKAGAFTIPDGPTVDTMWRPAAGGDA